MDGSVLSSREHRRGGRAGRVVAEVRADQLAVPGPAVLAVGGRVQAEVALARADEALERGLLVCGEEVTRRGVEDHHVVVGQDRVREQRAVLGGVDLPVLLRPERLDRGDARSGCASCRKPAVLENTSARSFFVGVVGGQHLDRDVAGGGAALAVGDGQLRRLGPGGGVRGGRRGARRVAVPLPSKSHAVGERVAVGVGGRRGERRRQRGEARRGRRRRGGDDRRGVGGAAAAAGGAVDLEVVEGHRLARAGGLSTPSV